MHLMFLVGDHLDGYCTSQPQSLSGNTIALLQAKIGLHHFGQVEVFAMEASFFKFAFIILMGLATLGLLTMATTVIVLGLKVVWLWLTTYVRTANTGA